MSMNFRTVGRMKILEVVGRCVIRFYNEEDSGNHGPYSADDDAYKRQNPAGFGKFGILMVLADVAENQACNGVDEIQERVPAETESDNAGNHADKAADVARGVNGLLGFGLAGVGGFDNNFLFHN